MRCSWQAWRQSLPGAFFTLLFTRIYRETFSPKNARRRCSRPPRATPTIDAIDVIVRGVKAGLPLGDCMNIIASEAAEPVRSEFRNIVDAQAVGLSLGEAVDRIVESVPVAEAKFFAIVINIQQKAGGNLSETLGNLSRVLRDRKRMRVKINAMSMEAKSSASIIGALPFVVAFMVYLTSPAYIELSWKTHAGQMALLGCGFWMPVVIMMMRKMINFDI
jgi:tight adherence protein B